MSHLPRLHRALRELINTRRVAALGTLDARDSTQPFVSMVPFALLTAERSFVIHVSALAAHTGNMVTHPCVSLMVMAAETADAPVQALPRVTFDARAQILDKENALWQAARNTYLDRFPEAEPITTLGDFRFVLLTPANARQVTGFGAARTVDTGELHRILG